MSQAGTLERLLLLAGEALQHLAPRLAPDDFENYLAEFGVLVPGGATHTSLVAPLADAQAAAARIAPTVAKLRDIVKAPDDADLATLIATGAELAKQIVATATALRAIASALANLALGVPEIEVRARIQAFAAELPRRMLGRLLLERLDRWSVQAVPLLAVLGLADDRMEPGVRGNPGQPAHYLRRTRFDRIGKLTTNPLEHFRQVHGWGTPQFDAVNILERIKWWFRMREKRLYWLGDIDLEPADADGLDLGVIRLQNDNSISPPGLAAELRFSMAEDFEREFDLGSNAWVATLASRSRFESGLRAVLAPSGQLRILADAVPTVSARARLSLKDDRPTPFVLLSLAGGSRLEIRTLNVEISVDGLSAEPMLRIQFEGLNCVFDLGSGDSFVKAVSGEATGNAGTNLGATWSPVHGLHFTGSGALDLTIPTRVSLGLATIDAIYLVPTITDEGIALELSAALRATIGPFTAVLHRVGAQFVVDFPEDGGNLGPARFDAHFKPPIGVGLSIDGRMVVGGGFLQFDAQKQEYSGILQLEIAEMVAVKAVGLLSTRLPDGSKGYSLLILISAEGFAPIQLGFGFTLTGIGGLLGVNRSVMVDVLRTGLKNGTLGSLLFPADPIRNAPQIVSDLRAVFPPVNRRYLLGPMLQLAWGTPTLLTLELGVIVELPDPVRLVILGRLQALLPNAQHALVQVRMDAIGVIDFNRSDVALDATLYDSRILQFALTGDMALRANWGTQPNFVLAIGGFHPRFAAPPGLPKLSRLALSLSDGDSLRLRCAAYLALTSNTVQFGARLDLHAAGGGFSFDGMLGFDALFQLAPLAFIVDVGAALALRYRGHLLVGIRFEGSLAGPTPWHVQGKATIKIFFFKVSVRFDRQFGQRQPPPLPAPVDALGLLIEALRDRRNWSAALPRGEPAVVSLRESPSRSTNLRVHPLAQLAVRQRVLPLNRSISKIGSAQLASGPASFTLKAADIGATATPINATVLTEPFALAQYQELSDEQQLAQPAFAAEQAGLEFGIDELAYAHEAASDQNMDYETLLIDPTRPPEPEPQSQPTYTLPLQVLDAVISLGAAGQTALRRRHSARYRIAEAVQ